MTENTSKSHWVPLESNPDVLTEYIHNLGVSNTVGFVDVFGLDPELLMMIPQPVYAIIFLYPLTEKSTRVAIGQEVSEFRDVYFIKQTIGNACGTMAVIHSLANTAELINLNPKSTIGEFLESTKYLDPDQKAVTLEKADSLKVSHEFIAQMGQTDAPRADKKLDLHFVSLVHLNGILYELDGRRNGPVKHGSTSAESFLKDSAQLIKKFMSRDPTETNFSVIALCLISE